MNAGETLSPQQVRRIFLAAQGFGARRPGNVGAAHLRRTVDRLGLHQIDSVNVLTRMHYLPAFSRLGGYDRTLLERDAWGPRRGRRLFEYWAHEASLLPVDLHPYFRWRMARAERGEIGWRQLRLFARERNAEARAVRDRIAGEGPLAASEFENGSSKSGWWEWSETKLALEWLFWSGQITTATRRGSFERVYDLSERVIPRAVYDLPAPDAATAQRVLIERSARALGVATATDLRDYFRLRPEEAKGAVSELEEEGTLIPVQVKGWTQKAWLHRDARLPRRVRGDALLAPFDPLIWDRARTERLFAFRSETSVRRSLFRYSILVVFNSVVVAFIVTVCHDHVGLGLGSSQLIATASTTVWNYFAYKGWVYAKRPSAEETQDPVEVTAGE